MHPGQQREAFPVGSVDDICLFSVAFSWWFRIPWKNTNLVWSPFYVTFNWWWWWLSLRKMSLAPVLNIKICMQLMFVPRSWMYLTWSVLSLILVKFDLVYPKRLIFSPVIMSSALLSPQSLQIHFPSSPTEWVVVHTEHYQILYRCISPARKIICHINENKFLRTCFIFSFKPNYLCLPKVIFCHHFFFDVVITQPN